tara:strand:- start:7293 stop:11579 length:4287 start_codon:yes stop_codon:yes gene_type:complete
MNPLTPHKDNVIGEWFSQKWHTSAINGRIESHVGQRSGEVFAGRCYQGETGAYIDVSSFVTGTLTVKCWWKKENGTVHAESLDYNAIDAIVKSVNPIEATNPQIELTTEVDDVNKHIALTNGNLYYGLHVYSNGKLVAVYLGEDGAGTIAYDVTGSLNHGILTNITLSVFHTINTDVPYSFLNELGYSDGKGLELSESLLSVLNTTYSSTTVRNEVSQIDDSYLYLYHDGDGSNFVFNGTLQTAGWLNGNYYLSYTDSSIFAISSGEYKASILKLKAQSITGVDSVTTTFRDYSIYQQVFVLLGIDSTSFSDIEDWFYAVSGTHPTYGDNYPNQILGSGQTSTEFRAALTSAGVYDVDSWLSVLESQVLIDGTLTPYYNSLIPIKTLSLWTGNIGDDILVTINLADEIPTGGLTGYMDDYFSGNINQKFRQLDNIIFRANSGLKEMIIEELSIQEEFKVPINLIDQTKDATGADLEYKGQVNYPLQLVESNCFQGNGIAVIDTYEVNQQNFYPKSIELIYNVSGTNQSIFGYEDDNVEVGNDNYFVRIDSSDESLTYRCNGDIQTVNFPNKLETGDYLKIEITQLDQGGIFSSITLYNHSQNWKINYDDNGSSSTNRYNKIGGHDYPYIDITTCKLFNLVLYDDIVVPISEGAGNLIYNSEGDAFGEIINGTYPDVWGKQNVFHWNAYEGFYENKLTVNEADALVVEIDTSIVEAGYTDEYSYIIDPGSTTSAYYVIADWGDGSSDVIKGGPKVHKYATSGVKTIKVYPYGVSSTVIRSVFSEYDQKKVLKVKQWGNTRLSWHQFRDCENLTIEAIDIPEINSDAVAVFQNCSALTTVPNIDQWDWSVVTNIENIFRGTGYDGAGMENIDLSNVTNMKYAFKDSPFNLDVSNWNTSLVELLTGTFWGCSSFEGTGVNNWNTSGLTNLTFAFADCAAFTGDVSGWNVSNVTAFDRCFSGCTLFNSNLSSWDVSSCIDGFNRVFQSSGFNNGEAHGSYTTPLTWDVSNAVDLSSLFESATHFNQELKAQNGIDPWDVSSVEILDYMFANTAFNQYVGDWNVSSVISMIYMFYNTSVFNNGEAIGSYTKPLLWDLTSLENSGHMFDTAVVFNQELKASNGIDPWNMSSVTNLRYMFSNSIFNQYIGDWDTSNVTSIQRLFKDNSYFNQNISQKSVTNSYGTYDAWNLTSCIDALSVLFDATSFNNGESYGMSTQPLLWETGNIEDFGSSFRNCNAFNQPLYAPNGIDPWDMSSVNTINTMFYSANSFNQYVGNWNLPLLERCNNTFFNAIAFNNGEVNDSFTTPIEWSTSSLMVDMYGVFDGATEYGQDISMLTMDGVTDVGQLFRNTKFDKDLTSLSFESVENMEDALLTTNAYSTANYDALLIELAAQAVQSGVTLDVNASYTTGGAAETARTDLINNYSWVINDNGGV